MADDPEIWLIAPEAVADELAVRDRLTGLLPAGDRARAATIKDAGEARFWHAARIALRLLVERRCGPAAARAEIVPPATGGRPSLAGAHLEISIAHARPLALVALASTPVGVDIEAVRPVTLAGERRRRIEAAATVVAGGAPLPRDEPARFIAAWCRIEAVAKATGDGLARTLSILGARGSEPSPSIGASLAGWAVRDLAVGAGVAAAAAARTLPTRIVARRFPDHRSALEQWLATMPGERSN